MLDLFHVIHKLSKTKRILEAKCYALNAVEKAATRFLCKAIRLNDEPIKINIDKSGAKTAAIKDYNDDEGTDIAIRQN